MRCCLIVSILRPKPLEIAKNANQRKPTTCFLSKAETMAYIFMFCMLPWKQFEPLENFV